MILILTRNPYFYSNIRLREELTNQGIQTQFLNPFSQGFPTPLSQSNFLLIWPRTSGTLFDDTDLDWVSNQQQNHSLSSVNSPQTLKLLRDKKEQFDCLQKNGWPVLPFLPMQGQLEDPQQLTPLSSQGPFLVKTIRGNQGRGQYSLDHFCSLQKFWNTQLKKGDQRYIVQKLIQNFREYRLLMLGTNILATVEKLPPSKGHLRNCGHTTWKSVPPQKDVTDLALSLMKNLELDFAAIEIIEMQGELFILEINGVPGWEEMERISQKNLTQDIVTKLISLKKLTF